MTKTELIYVVSQKTDLTKKDADAAVNATLAAIVEALKAGDKVQIAGFGAFEVKARAAHAGRNPKTGAAIMVPATNVVSFSAGKTFKDAVNEK